jgi:hypothetical protein
MRSTALVINGLPPEFEIGKEAPMRNRDWT